MNKKKWIYGQTNWINDMIKQKITKINNYINKESSISNKIQTIFFLTFLQPMSYLDPVYMCILSYLIKS